MGAAILHLIVARKQAECGGRQACTSSDEEWTRLVEGQVPCGRGCAGTQMGTPGKLEGPHEQPRASQPYLSCECGSRAGSGTCSKQIQAASKHTEGGQRMAANQEKEKARFPFNRKCSPITKSAHAAKLLQFCSIVIRPVDVCHSWVSGSHADGLWKTFSLAAPEKHDHSLPLLSPADLPPSSVYLIPERQPSQQTNMSSHKRNFQCFNAVGGESSHRSPVPFNPHTTRLPRIPQHGIMGHHELENECYLCSDHRHARALEAAETQLSPLYHAHPPHHHHPHQYVLRGLSRPEEAPFGHDHLLHHHRYNKRVMLVKSSDPLVRKAIVLHRKSMRSFSLFLEEISELMQYHIRKLYTQDGRKIDSVQSLLESPGIVLCVGREPNHPSIQENFQKTSSDKLPKLSADCNEEKERHAVKNSINHANKESENKFTKQSVSSDKSVPDGTDSPDIVGSCPPTGDGVREDDIEKRVRVNKDGSLSMEMKTSSSGVDVNSGSTGSGKSSDGAKCGIAENGDASQTQSSAAFLGTETEIQWKSEKEEEKREEDTPGTDDTNDSPRELPQTPSSSHKSTEESDNNGQKLPEEDETECQENTGLQSPVHSQRAQLAKILSQDPDPIWVLTLLTKIEKQFMKHYINAMKEFKVRWNLGENEQLDMMINELRAEVHKRIQASIDRELRKIQGQAGLPRPPKKEMSQASTTQAEGRRRRLKAVLHQSADSQAEKSDDSATGTSFSDQRNENIDDFCPCETCMLKKLRLPAEIRGTAPVSSDYDLKRILLMKAGMSVNTQSAVHCASHSENDSETKAAERLVEKVIVTAVKEVKCNIDPQSAEEAFCFLADEKEEDTTQEAEPEAHRDTVKALPEDSINELSKTEDETAYSESEVTGTVEEKFSGPATALEEDTEDDSGGEQCETESKAERETTGNTQDPLEKESEDENEEEKTPVVSAYKDQSDQEKGEEEDENDSVDEEADSTIAEDGAVEADVANSILDKCEKDEGAEESAYNTAISVSNKKKLIDTASETATEDDENEAVESTTAATSEHATEEDEAAKSVVASTEHETDSETTAAAEKTDDGGETGTASEDDSAEDSDIITNEDETSDKGVAREVVSNGAVAEATDDELAVGKEATVTTEDELNNDRAENEKETITEDTSEKEEPAEEGMENDEETGAPICPDENDDEATADESSEEPAETATTEDEMALEEQTAVPGEDDSKVDSAEEETATATDRDSDIVEAVERKQVDASESDDVDDLESASDATTGEDENAAAETTNSASHEQDTDRDGSEEEGTATDEEKLPAISAGESAEENCGTRSAGESSEDPDEEETPEVENEIPATRQAESKEEAAAAEREDEEAVEARTSDDREETGASSENGSAEDTDATTHDDETDGEKDGNDSKQSQKNDEAVDGGMVDSTEQPVTENSEDDEAAVKIYAEEETDAATSEHESDKETAANTTSARETDSDGETAEDKEVTSDDDLKEDVGGGDATVAEENDGTTEDAEGGTPTTDDDSEDSKAATTNDETSATEKEEENVKGYNHSNDKELEEMTGGEEQCNCGDSEADPESARDENASEEETDNLAIDEKESINGERTDADQTTEQCDTLKVTDDKESGDDESEARPGNESADETAHEASDENETSSAAEHIEEVSAAEPNETESSEKNAESSTAEDFQEEKSEDDKSHVQEPTGAEMPAEESEGEESSERESTKESESKCGRCTEDMARDEAEDHQTADEESGEPEITEKDFIKSNGEEESEVESMQSGEAVQTTREESTENAGFESAADEEQQPKKDHEAVEEAVTESEADPDKEESEERDLTEERPEGKMKNRRWKDNKGNTDASTETLNEDWSRDLGDSADGEDEAEEDSDEPTDDGCRPSIPSTANSHDASSCAAKETLLIPLDALRKESAESDGAYADVEDSETEIITTVSK
ncbi:unnamed protein product [Menidia menidia]|uniref:(Atlantic silverside) hypothetical protein n=1 Tax=Menidia menidia TaxID=238744 RepID=A0A8S4B1S1_9TELE|nr:unnamed protein product [Menidia menidia]